jgi:signal transduction histidine kinase
VSSVEVGPGPVDRRGTWWSATVQWRNWPLLVKLGMVLVVPVVSALVLGVLRVKTDVELANSYSATERVAALRTQFVSVLSAVQRERSEAVRAGGQLAAATSETDRAVDAMTEVVRRDPELGDAATGFAAVDRALDQLPAARRQVTTGADGMVVLSAYNAVTSAVLEFDRSLVGRFPDEDLAGTSIALGELLGMREQVALEQAIGNLALRDRALPEAGRQLLVEADVRFDDKVDDFRSQSPPALVTRYDELVQARQVTEFQELVDAVRTTDPAGLPFTRDQWEAASGATGKAMSDLTRQAAANLSRDSATLAESISDRAGLESVLLLTMVLLAAGIGGGLGRYLLRSVGQLRRTALDVANNRLPAAVEAIRNGEGAKVSVDPVPLRSTEEFGQLARAFDAVHGQAVRSAAEEASLRSNLANIFTNLSRRSQGLVERQLRLMEQLEQKTEDPEQLENLFKIDHLATRMRRNNENLMVLSGTGLLRRFTEPMPLPDVLRAAISEVEHYQRAVVRSVPDVRIAGYAAGDLIRSVSELIENATAFSPPDAQVSVVSRLLQDGSAVIDILDQGVGLGEKELREANQRITGGGGVDVPISRQMGLFVVGRLTSRHGIHVRLIPRAEGGVCASVLVPAGLVNIADPGATAALELPIPGQGPATATEWLHSSAPAAGWDDRVPATTSSWLTTATPGSGLAGVGRPTPDRSVAISWLTAAKKAETAIPTAAGETPTPAAPPAGMPALGTPSRGIPAQTGLGTPPSGMPSLGGTSPTGRSAGTPPAGMPSLASFGPAGGANPPATPPSGMPALADPASQAGTASLPGTPPAGMPSLAETLAGAPDSAGMPSPGTPPTGMPSLGGSSPSNPPATPPTGMHSLVEPFAGAPDSTGMPSPGTPPAGMPSLGGSSPSNPPTTPPTGMHSLAEPLAETPDPTGMPSPGGSSPTNPLATPPTGMHSLAETLAGTPDPTGMPSPAGSTPTNPPTTPPTGMPSLAGAAASAEPQFTTETSSGSPAEAAGVPSPAGVSGSGAEPSPGGEVSGATSVDPQTLAGIPAVEARLKPPSLPGEKFKPIEVAEKLESAGIVVSLPSLPDATTPASILFADNTKAAEGPDFSWLTTKSKATKTAPAAPVVTAGPAGLPKRVPRGQKAPAQQPPAATRNAARARGFMSDFQAGIRQSENREGESGS